MEEKQPKKHKNSFHLRVYDLELLKSMNELLDTGKYDSMNELLNCALGIGVEKIYLEFGKRKLFTKPPAVLELPDAKKIDNLSKKIDQILIMEEDMFVLMNSIESISASIYNVQRAEINQEPMSGELLDSGYLATLPQAYQDIKDKLVQRFNRKLEKEQGNK